MKAVVKKADLAMATSAVHNMVNPQSSMPILNTILIRAEENGVTFMASDTDASVRCLIEGEVAETGAATVPARMFSELVRELPEADIMIALDEESNVLVECDAVSYRLSTMDPEKYPAWPSVESQTTFTLPQSGLARAIESVVFAIPTRDPRKVLLGALFDLKEGRLVTVSTDGKKLGFVSQEPTETIGEQDGQAIVPHKVLTEVQKILGDEGEVTVTLGQRQISFDLGSTVYVANKIEGAYPNYEMVIPQSFENTLTLDRQGLIGAIRRASIISDEKNNSVILKFGGGQMEITSMTYDVGSFAGSMPVEAPEGFDFEIVFNHRFLLEVLRVSGGESIDLKINRPSSPAVVTCHGDEDALFVVMPIKLADLASGGEE